MSFSVLTILSLVVLGVVKLETELAELQTQLTKSTSELENMKSEAVKQVEAVKAESAAEAMKMQESTKQQVDKSLKHWMYTCRYIVFAYHLLMI